MAEFPALPLLTDAYLADTRHLTTVQHGAYLLMLIVAWRSPDCSLPNDDTYLARITGLDRRTWMRNKDTMLAFWRLTEQQKWVQGRLLDERNYVEQVRSKNAQAGRASALKRKNRGPTSVQPKGHQKATPTLTPTHRDSGTRVPSSPAAPPEWMPVDAWLAFKEMRKVSKAPMTPKAEELAIAKLARFREQGHDVAAILNKSTINNWKDLYEPREHGSPTHQHGNQKRGGDPASTAFHAAQSIIARRNAAAGISPGPEPTDHAPSTDLRLSEDLR